MEFELHGLEPVLAKLKNLRVDLQKKSVRAAARRAMNLVRDSARRKAKAFDDPKTQQAVIWKNIVTRESGREGKKVGGIVMRVGVAGGARALRGNQDTGHWRFVEFGTSKMPARPFMRPALEENVQTIAASFIFELGQAIDKNMAKV